MEGSCGIARRRARSHNCVVPAMETRDGASRPVSQLARARW
jgi:hypothetical protein